MVMILTNEYHLGVVCKVNDGVIVVQEWLLIIIRYRLPDWRRDVALPQMDGENTILCRSLTRT
jgi:hypothetical protein